MKNIKNIRKSPLWRNSLLAAGLTVAGSSVMAGDYSSVVKNDSPKAYYRLGDTPDTSLLNLNIGSLGAAGNATNDLAAVTGGTVFSIPGAISGDNNRASLYDYTTRTEIPFNPALNPPATQPFTMEAWMLPLTDQVGVGMGAICNRWTQGGPRQGWVMYQRAPDSDHCTSCGPGLGWEFRMYNGLDTSTHLDVISGVPFSMGKWQHVAVVYTPIGGSANNSMLVIYIDGVAAATNLNSNLSVPGYGPCTGDHDPGVAVNGQPNLALGGYNNANSGTAGFANPWFGGIDEFAFYGTALSPTQILAHYRNGTNSSRTVSYDTLIKSDNPVEYLRLNEVSTLPADVAVNAGSIRNSGNGTAGGAKVNDGAHALHSSDVNHPGTSAMVNSPQAGSASYHLRNGNSTTDLPYIDQNNPDASIPFTFEMWVRPTNDRQNPGAAAINNRYVSSGHRTGWVIFQRAPNSSYSGVSGYSGVGWNFRMYNGNNGSGEDVTTGVNYNVNEWHHLVVTWEPQTDNGPVGGGEQWQGILTAYFDGVLASQNAAAKYAANQYFTEDGSPASDLAVGAYNAASGVGQNPFEGNVANLAIYNNVVLSTNQIMAHFQAGNSGAGAAAYDALVYSAGRDYQTNQPGYSGRVNEGTDIPATYLKFDEAPFAPAANSGTLGGAALANTINAPTSVAGPQSPAFAGFEAGNTALQFDGTGKQWVSLNNPFGLEVSGQITLEAWINPSAQANTTARIISHGPTIYSSYLASPLANFGAPTNGNEVFLKIEGSGPFNYTVGSSFFTNNSGTITFQASAQAPDSDFTGSWVYIVGTYDGAKWTLYRNGVSMATSASAIGALLVLNGDWALGSAGEGWADNYIGGIDEAAIYDKALSSSEVAAHYSSALLGASPLSIKRSGANVIITWTAGKLQKSSSLAGPWTAVAGTSPLTTPATGRTFYRVSNN